MYSATGSPTLPVMHSDTDPPDLLDDYSATGLPVLPDAYSASDPLALLDV